MAFNNLSNMFNSRPSETNFGNGFNFKRKKNPFRALSFEQEPMEEEQSFAQNYPRPAEKSAYEQFLESAPKREDYERSKGAKIAAALLSGLSGYIGDSGAVERNQNALDRPFERAKEDYSYEGGRLKEQFGIQNARDKQDRDAAKAMQDYELAKVDHERADRLAGNTLATGATNRANTEDQMRRRPLSQRINERTGNLENINVDTGETVNLGSLAPSYDEKRNDTASEWDRQRGITFGNQRQLQREGRDNPIADSRPDTLTPSEQKTARDLAIQEFQSPGSKYSALFSVEGKLQRPEEVKAKLFKEGNQADVKAWDDLYKEFETALASRLSEIENKYRVKGRYEINPIK